jgi:site-specific recombinase XerD
VSDLIIAASTAILPATMQAEMDAARSFAMAEKSEATRRAYRSDFAIFTAWCIARGVADMPAAPETVKVFLASQAIGGTKSSTLGRRIAAIRYAHKLAGFDPPTNSEMVKVELRGIRRTIGAAPERKDAATADRVGDMLAMIPDTLPGIRDRALLLLGFAGAFRRSELVALMVTDLVETQGGLRVMIRKSKTDQEGAGQEIAIPSGGKLRAVEAVKVWLAAAKIESGPVFRSINRGGRVLPDALTDRSVALIVKAYAEQAGLNPAVYAGHSLRSGFLTSAADAGATVFKMMEVSRHKSIDTLRGYVRRANLFRDHAGATFL